MGYLNLSERMSVQKPRMVKEEDDPSARLSCNQEITQRLFLGGRIWVEGGLGLKGSMTES